MWENIRLHRMKSVALFIYMGLLLELFGAVFGRVYLGQGHEATGVIAASVVWFVLSLVAVLSGDTIILKMSGAARLEHGLIPQMSNIVEEMSIAAGLPKVPDVYIIRQDAPNAFAVGKSLHGCKIVVTTGLLTLLNRDELQGVIAHETAHIANHDAMFMTFSGIILGSISFAAEVFLRSLGFVGGRGTLFGIVERGSANYWLLKGMFIALLLWLLHMVIGTVLAGIAAAVLIPYLVKIMFYAVSRRREFLADASAVRLTRYPEGLASALEKISAPENIAAAGSVNAPMCIINPDSTASLSIWSIGKTHPPVNERIRILRAVGAGAGKLNYHEAYRAATGRSSRALSRMNIPMELFSVTPASDANEAVSSAEQHRRVHDTILKIRNYSFIACPCGMQLKIPAGFGMNKPQLACPKCGTLHVL